jgi:NADPH:quinone reductase-like Zn-dependent oxidoreductase
VAYYAFVKAIVQDSYGSFDALRLEDIDPPAVGDDEVLVRVRAASVHPDIWHVIAGRPYVLRLMGAGLRKPKNRVPGTDMAGRVETLGKNVTQFKPGDEVFGETLSGYQWTNGGTFAEYVSVKQEYLAMKPAHITFEQAAAVPTSGLIALQNLRGGGGVQPGQKVLVNGAAGGVGAIALQLAKAYGATVTGVDTTKKLEMVLALGADHVIDYTHDDFTRGSERYDLIFDVPGNHPFSACRRALTPRGLYVLIGHEHFGESGHRILGLLPSMLGLAALSLFVRQLPKANFSLPPKKDSMAVLKGFLETGQLTPIVARTFPLSEAPQALRCLQEGQVQGKIVIIV